MALREFNRKRSSIECDNSVRKLVGTSRSSTACHDDLNVAETCRRILILLGRTVTPPPTAVDEFDQTVLVAQFLTAEDYWVVVGAAVDLGLTGRIELMDGVLTVKKKEPYESHGGNTYRLAKYFDDEVLCKPDEEGKRHFARPYVETAVDVDIDPVTAKPSVKIPDAGFALLYRCYHKSGNFNFVIEVANSQRVPKLREDMDKLFLPRSPATIFLGIKLPYDKNGMLKKGTDKDGRNKRFNFTLVYAERQLVKGPRPLKKFERKFNAERMEELAKVANADKGNFKDWPVVKMSFRHVFYGVIEEYRPNYNPMFQFNVLRIAECLKEIDLNQTIYEGLAAAGTNDADENDHTPAEKEKPAGMDKFLKSYKFERETEEKRRQEKGLNTSAQGDLPVFSVIDALNAADDDCSDDDLAGDSENANS